MQPSFEDLIAASLDCLGRGDDVFNARQISVPKSLAETVSVDEFLYSYRPKPVHVHEFFLRIGESTESAPGFRTANMAFDMRSVQNITAIPRSAATPPDKGPFKHTVQARHLPEEKSRRPLGQPTAGAGISKREHARLSADSKLERRREQNREAQRRLRDRRMLQGL